MSHVPPSAARAWSAVTIVGAVALFFGGGALDNFRPLPSGAIPPDTALPVLETPSGEVPEPPSEATVVPEPILSPVIGFFRS